MMKLNLGSGRDYKEGWINVDQFYKGFLNVNNNIVILESFQSNTADEILASHSLEHLGKVEGILAMKRWFDVLKPGGTITIVVPNIPVQVRLWLEAYEKGEPDVWGFRSHTLWGNQNNEGEYHRYGYDVDSLRLLLQESGFINMWISTEPGRDLDYEWVEDGQIRAVAFKPDNAAA